MLHFQPPTDSPAWKQLQTYAIKVNETDIKQYFEQSHDRFRKFSWKSRHLLLDLSKQRFDKQVLNSLLDLANERLLEAKIEELFSGISVNLSEDRPALHTALRAPSKPATLLTGINISAAIHANLDRMQEIVEQVHSCQWRGFTGHSIDTIVNIGVGGSDLGPLMATTALSDQKEPQIKPISVHFVSSMDGSQLATLLKRLNPARTLFVISSKSFTTVDTLANAETAKEWLSQTGSADITTLIARHFIGVSANPDKMTHWGIPESNQLLFWDWTGGRYSLWSAIGLPIALKLGMSRFRELLAGAHQMDQHFRTAPFSENLPVLLALAGIWNINFLKINAHAILPYDGRLKHLPAYLEQLEMESNGKSVTQDGTAVNYNTCPILWGEIGSNAQHAFYQLLHQGTEAVMCDFIVAANRYQDHQNDQLSYQHKLNTANCLAQSRLLAFGDSVLDDNTKIPPHKRYRGNHPCTTIVLDELNAYSLGQLIALYEHKVYVQSVIWGINPFDQWGVELGKAVATSLQSALDDNSSNAFDDSTNGLLHHIASLRGA